MRSEQGESREQSRQNSDEKQKGEMARAQRTLAPEKSSNRLSTGEEPVNRWLTVTPQPPGRTPVRTPT
jgi:hypothetical protein